MIPAVAIAAFVVGMMLGGLLIGRAARGMFLICLVALGVLFALCLAVPQPPDSYARFGLVVAAYLGCLPAVAGMLAGGLGGWVVQRHRAR